MIILGEYKDYDILDLGYLVSLDKICYSNNQDILKMMSEYFDSYDFCKFDSMEGTFVNNVGDDCYGKDIIVKPDEYRLPTLRKKYKIYNRSDILEYQ